MLHIGPRGAPTFFKEKMALADTITVITEVIKAWGGPAVAISIGGTAAVSVWGPRIGPLRALVFGLRSRYFLHARRTSQRTDEVERVRAMLALPEKDRYTVVVGQKGVGKSCIVDTLIEGLPGVAVVGVDPGTSG